jgi:hypothetical protein
MNFHPKENSIDTAKVVVPLLIDWYRPTSVLDLGCNIGAWLSVFRDNGVLDVIGIDGDNMLDSLVIPKNNFCSFDLTKPIQTYKPFDMVLCLEVAEHLEEQYADTLIDTAILHSDLIIWSAATKGQGGYNHVNEQPVEYWIEKFKQKGYKARDLSNILPILPHDYYRKNAIEFKRE